MSIKDKNESGILIELERYYPENCSLQKVTEVSRELYEFLETEERKENAAARKDCRYLAGFGFDEERDGMNSLTAVEMLFDDTNKLVNEAVANLPEYERRIITLKYFDNKKILEISAEIGVPKTSLCRHIEKAKKMLAAMLEDIL